MSTIEQGIEIEVPVRTAYDQWTQFEEFPKFMEGVEEVRQHDDTHLHWRAKVAGSEQEWDAEITEQTPDQRIAWTSTSGDRNAGAVDFHRISDQQTRITLTMDVAPSGVVEKVGDALGVPAGQVEGDLKRFKEFIEARGTATGAWRGEVEQNNVTGSSGSSSGLGASGSTGARELAGAGSSMGTVGSGSDLGSDYGSSAGTTGTTGTTGSTVGGATGGLSGYESGGDLNTGTSPTGTDNYGSAGDYNTGAGTGSTGTGDMGTGLNDPQDLGTTRRENDRGF